MDCICTAIGCGSLPPDIKILANVKNAAEGVFTDYEINAFYLIRTTDKFEIIDSIEMDFQSIQGILDYKMLKKDMKFISKDEVGPQTLVSEADRVFAIIIFCLWYDLFFS